MTSAQNSTAQTSTTAPALGTKDASSNAFPGTIVPEASTNKILLELLGSAQNLPKVSRGNIGSIHLTLKQLQNTTQSLRHKEAKDNNYTKAHYLLSGSGINAADFEDDLKYLPTLEQEGPRPLASEAAFSQQETLSDIEKVILAKKDESILNAIEMSLASATKDFDLFINQNISIDWKVRKDNLRKSLGMPVKKRISAEDLDKSFAWNKNMTGTNRLLSPLASSKPSVALTRQVTRDKFESMAKVVYGLNEARLHQKAFPLCLSLEELSKTNTDTRSRQMSGIWKILADLCSEKFAHVTQEQSFYGQYNKPHMEASFKRQLLNVSKASLEEQLFHYVEEVYVKNNSESSDAQPATNVNKVVYFIQKIITKNDTTNSTLNTASFNGVLIWALLFYLMRCGLYEDALQLANSNKEVFEKFDKNLPIYLSHYVKSGCIGLPSDLQQRIQADYNQHYQFYNEDAKDFDAYKYAVYKIIGKCDLARKTLPSSLNLSVEDWLWFHLLIINDTLSHSALLYENYTIENLQNKVLSLGSSRFNASSNHPMYARTLVMLGLYELAVQYVYENVSECDAVHLAISLAYYGLLKTTSSKTDDLIITVGQESHAVNFSRLLGSYTRTFKISDPKVAAQYLILVCLSDGGKNAEETKKCHEALRELILVLREYGLLLGEVNPDSGDKIPGMLEKQRALFNLEDISSYYSKIVESTAQVCEEESRILDALRLYQLCQDYNTVVALINRYLSEILSMSELDKSLLDIGQQHSGAADSPQTSFIIESKRIVESFKSNSFISQKVTAKEREVNKFLLAVVSIRQSFVHKAWQETLDKVKELAVVPLVEDGDFIVVRNAAESVKSYDATMVKVIPSLLIIVLMCISQLNRDITSKKYGFGEQERQHLDALRNMAKNCMVYAGMIQYRMPRETYSLLVNIESQL